MNRLTLKIVENTLKTLKEEIRNDLTSKEIQEREFYDTGYFYDGYLKALVDFSLIDLFSYNTLVDFKESFTFKKGGWMDKKEIDETLHDEAHKKSRNLIDLLVKKRIITEKEAFGLWVKQ